MHEIYLEPTNLKFTKVFQVPVQVPKLKDSGQKFAMTFFIDILKQSTATTRLGILVVTCQKCDDFENQIKNRNLSNEEKLVIGNEKKVHL